MLDYQAGQAWHYTNSPVFPANIYWVINSVDHKAETITQTKYIDNISNNIVTGHPLEYWQSLEGQDGWSRYPEKDTKPLIPKEVLAIPRLDLIEVD